MGVSRTWNLRLNLDEFNALVASLYSDADKALAIQGMMLGANCGALPEGTPPAFRRGWDLGNRMHKEAAAFQEAQAERGRASAEKRRERTGSAQPHKDASRTTVRTPLEPPFEPPFEPNNNPQSTIQETAIQQQPARTARDVLRSSAERREQAEAIYQAYPRRQGKGAALPVILRALDKVPFDQLLEAVQAFAVAVEAWPEKDHTFVPHPATWIRGERWNDDRTTWRRGSRTTTWNNLGAVDHHADIPGARRISDNVSIL